MDIPPAAIAIFNHLSARRHCNDLSIRRIAIQCELNEKTVRRNVKRLRRAGLVEVNRGSRGVPYSFEIKAGIDVSELSELR